jgi:hypothetical protein
MCLSGLGQCGTSFPSWKQWERICKIRGGGGSMEKSNRTGVLSISNITPTSCWIYVILLQVGGWEWSMPHPLLNTRWLEFLSGCLDSRFENLLTENRNPIDSWPIIYCPNEVYSRLSLEYWSSAWLNYAFWSHRMPHFTLNHLLLRHTSLHLTQRCQ